MDETPDDPRPPDEVGDGTPTLRPPGQLPPDDPAPPGPLDDLPPLGDDPAPLDPLGNLPPLDDDAIPLDGRRRTLGGWRLAAAGVAVLALIGGGAAFALGGGGDDGDDATDGVASVDGGENTPDEVDAIEGGNGSRTPDPEFQDAMLEYAECMRDNGVDMPDPEFEGGGGVVMRRGSPGDPDDGGLMGPGNAEWEAAQEECGPIMDDVGPMGDPPSAEEQAEMQDQLVAMAECMRGKGYDMPDPEVSSDGGVGIRVGSGAGGDEMDGEQFNEDQQECNDEAGLENGPMGGPPPEEDS